MQIPGQKTEIPQIHPSQPQKAAICVNIRCPQRITNAHQNPKTTTNYGHTLNPQVPNVFDFIKRKIVWADDQIWAVPWGGGNLGIWGPERFFSVVNEPN
jgi:hypothetical protein